MGVRGKFKQPRVGGETAFHRFVKLRGFRLERDVADPEAVAEERGEVGQDVFGAAGIGEFDMGAHRGKARGDRPDVHIVEGENSLHFEGGIGNALRFEAAGRALQEDAAGLAEEHPCTRQDERGDRETDKRIDAGPGAEGDSNGRNDHRDGPECISEGFERGAADVQVVVRMAVKDAKDEKVHEQAGGADRNHWPGGDFGR